MLNLRLLPWEYGVRNLLRRPGRSLLTMAALATVVLLVFVVVAFIRGLETSLAASGDASVVLVYSINASEDIENSAIPARTAPLLSASLPGVDQRFGVARVSPELYVATRVRLSEDSMPLFGLVRGVTPAAPLVRKQVQLIEGNWPKAHEVIVGKLVHAKLGCPQSRLAIGQTVTFDNQSWKICGTFAANGSAYESELWVPLEPLQAALKRQDLSLVALGLAESAQASEVELFCKERVDLELQALSEKKYYAALQKHYQPVRLLGWVVVALVAGAGVFSGLNTMYGAVVGRVQELSTLQAIGYRRRAIAVSLIQEAVLLSAAATLIAAILALVLVNGAAVRFTMGAFALRVDSMAILIGSSTGLLLGLLGAIPPAIKAMRTSVLEGLKAV